MNRKSILLIASIILLAISVFGQGTYLKLTLDSKQLPPDHGLGGGGGLVATANKVYAHLGLCTCNMIGEGINAMRNCSNSNDNMLYCISQIKPYHSNVWQHVVGNWGEDPQDDSIGTMTNTGNGVYIIEFIIEQYFSNPNIVSTASEGPDVVPSAPWNTSEGFPYTLGMVFRNEDGSLDGRDAGGGDIFAIYLTTDSVLVIQSSQMGVPFPAVTIISHPATIEEINRLVPKASIYPNPFDDYTHINFYLKEAAKNLDIKIYNTLGQEIKYLYHGLKSAGKHQVSWDGKDNRGKQVHNGMYFIIIKTEKGIILTERVELFK